RPAALRGDRLLPRVRRRALAPRGVCRPLRQTARPAARRPHAPRRLTALAIEQPVVQPLASIAFDIDTDLRGRVFGSVPVRAGGTHEPEVIGEVEPALALVRVVHRIERLDAEQAVGAMLAQERDAELIVEMRMRE